MLVNSYDYSVKRLSGENIRIKKQYRTMRQSLQHKIQSLQQNIESTQTVAANEKNERDTLQTINKDFQTENEKLKGVVKVLYSNTIMCFVAWFDKIKFPKILSQTYCELRTVK